MSSKYHSYDQSIENANANAINDPNNQYSLQQQNSSNSSSSSSFHSDTDYAWIPWFCSLKGNEFFCEVEDSFASDSFNLTGLSTLVPYFDYALDMILDVESVHNSDNPRDPSQFTESQQEAIENDSETLYGLIHARFIITHRGLQAMLLKYRSFHFGRCPRVLCRGQALLPIGLSDQLNQDSVKLYCCRCEDVYHTKSTRHEHIDGKPKYSYFVLRREKSFG